MASPINHLVGSVLAGLLFALGWWLLIDGAVYTSQKEGFSLEWYEYFPAVCSSVFLIMINLVSLDHMHPDNTQIFMTNNDSRPMMIKIWLFVWFTLSFCAIGGGISIMIIKYPHNYLGWTVLAQPVIVFLSALLWLLSRRTGSADNVDPMMA